jgi:LacI family transcriptional regulator
MPPQGTDPFMSYRTQRGANLQAVADAAGVHRSTASRALNPATQHMISADIAQRIREASLALGYRRDVMAAGLRTRRSHLVGVLVPDIANPVFGPILSGIESALTPHGYSLLIVNAGNDSTRQSGLAEDLIARQVDGIVLATVQRDDPVLSTCLETGLPIVLVNRAETRQRACSVVADAAAGMGMAVGHLASLGHKAIGHIAGPSHLSTGLLRRQGFEVAMKAENLSAAAVVEADEYTREAGFKAAVALFDAHRVTAVAAANDLLALGVYQALVARGLCCPDDVSVVGYNDMPLVDMVQPPLTTIRISPTEMGRDAGLLLLELMTGERSELVTRIVQPQFVLRASTREVDG